MVQSSSNTSFLAQSSITSRRYIISCNSSILAGASHQSSLTIIHHYSPFFAIIQVIHRSKPLLTRMAPVSPVNWLSLHRSSSAYQVGLAKLEYLKTRLTLSQKNRFKAQPGAPGELVVQQVGYDVVWLAEAWR